jgi:hypothetical protein
MLNGLVHDDWSWTGVAAALDRAGIAYGTGKPWQAEQLRAKIVGTRRPLRYASDPLAKVSGSLPVTSSEDECASEISPSTKPLDLHHQRPGADPIHIQSRMQASQTRRQAMLLTRASNLH